MKIITFLSVVLLWIGFSHPIFAQDNVPDSRRAEIICEFFNQLTWHNDKALKELKVGVLEPSPALSTAINQRVSTLGKIRDKQVRAESINSTQALDTYNVIFLNTSNTAFDIENINTSISGKGILLVTEAASFGSSMLNFVVIDGKMRYEMNTDRLDNEGFTYSHVLSFASIKNKENWEALFKATKQELDEEKVITSQQREQIAEQEQIIAQKAKEIEAQNARLAAQKAELLRQKEQLDAQKKLLQEQKAALAALQSDIRAKQNELEEQEKSIAEKDALLQQKLREIEQQEKRNAELALEIDAKQKQIGELNDVIDVQSLHLKQQKIIIALMALLGVLLILFAIYLYRNYKRKQRTAKLLAEQNQQLTLQKQTIEEQHAEITDSIRSAQRIQTALLPKRYVLENALDIFVFYRPRDIVSGDFYWMSQKNDKLIIVAADCTGHGVPGAFMSMLGISFLNEIIAKQTEFSACSLLNELRQNVINSLNQAGESEVIMKEGMDIVLCVIDYPNHTLQYAGAYNPLILIRDGELQEIKADKMPVAHYDYAKPTFTNHSFDIQKNDRIYMFSDGYADQFGGDSEKKFSSKRLKQTLLDIHQLPIKEQEDAIGKTYDQWKGQNAQVDDVLLIGIRL